MDQVGLELGHLLNGDWANEAGDGRLVEGKTKMCRRGYSSCFHRAKEFVTLFTAEVG